MRQEEGKRQGSLVQTMEAEPVVVSEEESHVFLSEAALAKTSTTQRQEGNKTNPVTRDKSGSVVVTMDACFKSFDKDEDQSLNINEFKALLKALFRNEKGCPYAIDDYTSDIFNIFNKSGDGSLSKEEFVYCWNAWIKKIVRPVSALVVVDVQNDFISGSLAISNCPAGQDGAEVVEPISKLIETVPFDAIFYSLDWHPANHISFIDNVHMRKLDPSSPIHDPSKANTFDSVIFEGPPKTEQILWPAHCIQDTWGAKLHDKLKVHPDSAVIHKGTNPDIDSYSAFFDNQKLGHTQLEELLRSKGVTDVYVCGIALDVCVASTAFHAQELNFRTIFIDDCSRGIKSEDIQRTYEKVKENNGVVVHSSEIKALVQGRDRRVELGYQLAINCRKNLTPYPPKNKNSRFNAVPAGLGPDDQPSDGRPTGDKNAAVDGASNC